MPQDLGGIANPLFEKITWQTASDWDNAVDQEGVVHIDDIDRDTAGAGTIQLGYPNEDQWGNALTHYYPHDRSSGDLLDKIGSNNGTPDYGVKQNASGVFGSSAWQYDGDDDRTYMDSNIIRGDGGSFTFAFWFQGLRGGSRDLFYSQNKDYLEFKSTNSIGGDGGNVNIPDTNTALNLNEWYHVTYTVDSGNYLYIYLDGVEESKEPSSGGSIRQGNPRFSDHSDGSFKANVRMEELRYYDRALSASEVASLADPSGHLTTDTKSFNNPQKPELDFLDYTLNGETIEIDVIGSPGTGSEETVSQDLDGAASYSLEWSNSHTDFRLKIKPSTEDVEVTPTLSSASLEP